MTFYQHATGGDDRVATSPDLWRPFSRAYGGFDLDPASGAENSPIADKRYTVEDDGLSQPWFGDVWLNPPFSNKEKWYRKIANELNRDVDTVTALAPTDTSTVWFHRWFARADYICLLEGRDWYEANPGNGGSPSFCTMVGLFNPNEDAIESANYLGSVFKPV